MSQLKLGYPLIFLTNAMTWIEATTKTAKNWTSVVLAVSAILVFCLVYFTTHISVENNPFTPQYSLELDDIVSSPADNQAIFANALEAEYAIVFVHADWSLTSEFGKRKLPEFLSALNSAHPNHRTLVHFADFTSGGLINPIPGQQFISHGNGELLWLKSGILVGNFDAHLIDSADQFVQLTEAYFSSQ